MLWICCRRFDLLWICCGFAVDFWFVVDLLYSLLYSKSTTNHISPNSTCMICCGFGVQQAVQQIHSKSTTSWHDKMLWICYGLYSKSTTSPQQIEIVEFGFWQVVVLSWRCSRSQWAVISCDGYVRHYTSQRRWTLLTKTLIINNCIAHWRVVLRTTISQYCGAAIWMPMKRRNWHDLGCHPHSALLQVWHVWCMLIIATINSSLLSCTKHNPMLVYCICLYMYACICILSRTKHNPNSEPQI